MLPPGAGQESSLRGGAGGRAERGCSAGAQKQVKNGGEAEPEGEPGEEQPLATQHTQSAQQRQAWAHQGGSCTKLLTATAFGLMPGLASTTSLRVRPSPLAMVSRESPPCTV